MDILFLCLVVFLFLLAIFDLSVGVSNDAVNFLNSALGSKAAPFKRVLIVASIGVFIGAAMSNGMMDIARHGIFRPEHFSFYDLICIFMAVTEAFASENVKVLGKAASSLLRQKNSLKNTRRKETLGLRRIRRETAIEMSAWFHLSNNCCMSMLYNLSRINEICREHVDNNFMPLPEAYRPEYNEVRSRTDTLFNDTLAMMDSGAFETIPMLRRHCDEIKDYIAAVYHRLQNSLREDNPASMTVLYVYINVLQETQEMVSAIRKYLRAYAKLHGTEANPRPIVTVSA